MPTKKDVPLESVEQAKFIKVCPYECVKLHMLSVNGLPDLMILTPGTPTFLEFKRRGEEPSKLQAHWIRKLRTLGYTVGWTDDATHALVKLRKLVDTRFKPRSYYFEFPPKPGTNNERKAPMKKTPERIKDLLKQLPQPPRVSAKAIEAMCLRKGPLPKDPEVLAACLKEWDKANR